MREDPASAIKLERADERINEEVMRHSEGMMEEPPPEEEPKRRRRTRRTEDVGQFSKRARTSEEAPREPTLEEDIEEAAQRFPTLSGEADAEGGVAPDERDGDGDHEMGLIDENGDDGHHAALQQRG